MRIAVVPLLSLVLLGSGCLEHWGPPACPSIDVHHLTGPIADDGILTRSPGRTPPFLYWATNPTDSAAEIRLSARIEAGSYAYAHGNGLEPSAGPNQTAFGMIAQYEGQEWTLQREHAVWLEPNVRIECTTTGDSGTRFHVGEAEKGAIARPGFGAHVQTAGFWTNGTLFYTNMDRVHNDTQIPRAGWYEFEGGQPLPVYVYNESTSERPPRYQRAGFANTIAGFNAALHSLQTTSSIVVFILPEDAYTRPGAEDHRLYGDALVFYIEVKSVEDLPCEVPHPGCDVPIPPSPVPDPWPFA